MGSTQNFRTAFNGFNREDVVHYLEYINAKHNNQINQLTAENEALRARVEALPEAENQQLLVDSLEEKCRDLEAKLAAAEAERSKWEQQLALANAKCAQLEQAAQKPEEPESALSPIAADELEAYRRAERIEREARERAELVYFQVDGVLKETGAKVDGVSAEMTQMADEVMSQLTQLQVAVSASKQALQDAASIMGTIRPNNNKN